MVILSNIFSHKKIAQKDLVSKLVLVRGEQYLSFSFYICFCAIYLNKFQKSHSESEEKPKYIPLFLLNLRKFNLFTQTLEICNPARSGKDQITGTGAEAYGEIISFWQPSDLTTLKVEDLRTL